MGKKKIKEEEKNRFHREYGALSNLVYVAKGMVKYDKMTVLTIFLSAVCTPIAAYLWTFMSKFVIDVITRKDPVEKLIIIICITFTVQAVVTVLQSYMWAQWWRYVGARMDRILQKNLRFMTMPYEYLEDKDAMDCYQKAGNACNGNDEGIEGMMRFMQNSAADLVVVIIGLGIMGTLNGYVMLGLIVLSFFTFLIRNRTKKITKLKIWDPLATWWRKDYYMSQTFTDFNFAKDIRMYGLKDYLIRKYKEISRERIDASKKNELWWWICGFFTCVLWVAALLGLYAWLIYSVIYTDLTIGNFTLYLGSATTFFSYTGSLFDRVTELLAKSREIDDFRSFMDITGESENEGEPVPKADSYEFVFENVSFKYPGTEKFALKNMSITVKAGEKLAVVGLNGAGKSTFIKLLLRLYEPTEGRILLNGVDVRKYKRSEYYKVFSPVFQDVWLFAFPLKENVSMNSSEDTDDAKVKQVLEDSGMKEAVEKLTHGIDTEVLKVVSDEGVDFSGGEKQKIALARALYKNGPVVVLDEPTAALDALAEAKLYEDFDKLIGNRTAIYISHRLSSTRFCDHVAMFAEGELIEYGTHDSLLAAGGAYSEMFNVQAAYYVEGGEENGQVAEA